MRRREFITLLGGAAAWPLAARAQQPDRMRRIGVLMFGAESDPVQQARLAAFLDGLQQLGWTDGRNVRIDTRWPAGGADRSRTFAAELVGLAPDVILATSSASVAALQQASRSAPIVFANVIDPVGAGFVASLAQPGGNATGFTAFEYGISGKWLELLKEIAPRVTRVAVLRDPALAAGIGQFAAIQSNTSSYAVELSAIDPRDVGEMERALVAFARKPNGGLVVTGSGSALIHRDQIIALATRLRLPNVYPFRFYPLNGGLASYGPNEIDQYRRAAGYVDRILKGEKPADLPVQAPVKYELVINLKTAKTLGLDSAAVAARPRRRGDRMKRREFITLLGGAAAAWPIAALAQATRLPTIGYLGSATLATESQRMAAFVQRLRELGWIEGRTVVIDYRWAEGRTERYAGIAAEFVRLKVDVIVTVGGAVGAAKQATATIPIVFAGAGDPVGSGMVTSLAQPGGNVTGLSVQSIDLAGKQLEILREIFPDVRRLAIIGNVEYAATVLEMGEAQAAAHTLGLEVVRSEIRRAEDLAPAFEALKGAAQALYVCPDATINANHARINTLALGARLPTMHGVREYVEAGGLMSYGPNLADLYRRAADYVDKILRGAKPADLPVEQPTKFDLVINLVAAQALGLTVPPTLLARADEVIE